MAEVIQFADVPDMLQQRYMARLQATYATRDYPRLAMAWSGLQVALRTLGVPGAFDEASGHYIFNDHELLVPQRAGLPMQRRLRVSAYLCPTTEEARKAMEKLMAAPECDTRFPHLGTLFACIEDATTQYAVEDHPLEGGRYQRQELVRPSQTLRTADIRHRLGLFGFCEAQAHFAEIAAEQINVFDGWATTIGSRV